jgi:hypothetical protein
LPEFQGFNIGIKFMSFIAKMYSEKKRVRLTTSLKPFIMALTKNKKWKCVRYGRVGKLGKSTGYGSKSKINCEHTSVNRISATFQYIK